MRAKAFSALTVRGRRWWLGDQVSTKGSPVAGPDGEFADCTVVFALHRDR